MRNYFANPQYLTETAASDMIQIDDKFRIFLVDGYAYVYSISSVNTGYFGNPVNRMPRATTTCASATGSPTT